MLLPREETQTRMICPLNTLPEQLSLKESTPTQNSYQDQKDTKPTGNNSLDFPENRQIKLPSWNRQTAKPRHYTTLQLKKQRPA